MHCGSQLMTPEGWRTLRAGETYHFLRNRKGQILLVRFVGDQKRQPQAHLIQLPQGEFEEAIEGGHIVACAEQHALPPWLSRFEDVDLSQIDTLRPQAKKSHASRVEERLLVLLPAIQQAEAILDAPHPDRLLNAIARSCQPAQNETRYRLWFYTYLCFGRNSWVLLPPFHRIGHHNRFAHPDSKQGRPNKAFGKHYGFGCRPEVVEGCIRGWLKHSGLQRTLQEIYRRTMLSEFQCQTAKTSYGTVDFVQPDGKPFPTFWQFRYRVLQRFGLQTVQLTLYGRVRHRARLAAAQGAFSETVANLMERIDADAYNSDELPKGFIEGSTLPALSVVVARDWLSGLKLGIGFSFGAERTSAYRAMLFCMAVPKDFYCSLFGIKIKKKDWPNEGVPGFLSLDRGPGASKNLLADLISKMPIREIVPSWAAQSKAIVESSHPRAVRIEGAPLYRQSDLTPVQLAKQEIYRLLNYNRTADMSEHFQPMGDLALIPPDPISLWEYYDRRFRNDALPISIAEALNHLVGLNTRSLRTDLKLRITTNLGNALDHVGRFVEAVELWDRALTEHPNYAMALGNRGQSLFWYSRYVEAADQQAFLLRESYRSFRQASKLGVEPHARKEMLHWTEHLSSKADWDNLDLPIPGFSGRRSKRERAYRKWCVENRLVLNQINDATTTQAELLDTLTLPSIFIAEGEPRELLPAVYSIFNQLKQEYVAARFVVFEALEEKEKARLHFADRGVVLYDALDYRFYRLWIEKLKMAFLSAHAILDKMAYLINEYWRLSISIRSINFGSVWYTDGDARKGLSSKFTGSTNWPLRGLHWLSRDFYYKPKSLQTVLPEAKVIHDIRNHIAHKYLRVHDHWLFPAAGERTRNNTNAGYPVTDGELEAHTLTLLKLVRSALIYLSSAVAHEEMEKKKSLGEALVFPMPITVVSETYRL